MNKPIIALMWHCWRLCRAELVLWLLALAFLSLLFWSMTAVLEENLRQAVALTFLILLSAISVTSFGWTRGLNGGEPFAFASEFSKPVSTSVLVLTPLAVLGLKSCLTVACSLLVFQPIAEFEYSICKPIVAAAWVTFSLVSISWAIPSIGARIGLLLAATLICFGALMRYVVFAPAAPRGSISSVWLKYEWALYAIAGLGMMGSAILAVWGVHRRRHQRHVNFFRWRFEIVETSCSRPVRLTNRFHTPFRGLVWYQLKKLGFRYMIWAIVVHLLLSLFINIGARLNSIPISYQADSFGVAVLITTFLLFGLLASLQIVDLQRDSRQGSLQFFEGAHPVSNQQLAFAKLTAVFINGVLGSLIALISFAVFILFNGFDTALIVRNWPLAHELFQHLSGQWSWLVVSQHFMLLAVVSVLVLSWCLYAGKYSRWMLGIFCAVLVTLVLIGLDSEQDWQYRELWAWLAVILPMLLALVSLFFASRSIAKKLINTQATMLIVGFWCVGLVLLVLTGFVANPNSMSRTSPFVWVPIVAGTWIPAGLAISLPAIVASLRHR